MDCTKKGGTNTNDSIERKKNSAQISQFHAIHFILQIIIFFPFGNKQSILSDYARITWYIYRITLINILCISFWTSDNGASFLDLLTRVKRTKFYSIVPNAHIFTVGHIELESEKRFRWIDNNQGDLWAKLFFFLNAIR